MANITLATIASYWKDVRDWVKGTDAVSAPAVKLTGSKVTEIQSHNAIAITDTANKDSVLLDLTVMGGRKYIHVYNTLDQDVTLSLIIYTVGGGNGVVSVTKVIPKNSFGTMITATDIPALGEPIERVLIRAKCAIVPSTGLFSSWIVGRLT